MMKQSSFLEKKEGVVRVMFFDLLFFSFFPFFFFLVSLSKLILNLMRRQ